MIMLGDLALIGGQPPAKLVKALAVIGAYLHPELTKRPTIASLEKTKESCVLCASTVREFLFRIGFRDVEVAPVVFAIRALKDGELLHTLGIGDPEYKAKPPAPKGYWKGHLIARVPSAGYLIDPTLFRAARPQWPELPGMMAAPLGEPDDDIRPFGLKPIAGVRLEETEDGRQVDVMWLDQPGNNFWRTGPDYQRRAWRLSVADRLVELFGEWRDD